MKEIDAKDIDYRNLNEMIRSSEDKEVRLTNVLGQRFIGTALASGTIYVEGIPGPAMGSYLDGGCIFACLDASDAIGDTMNDGQIVVSGSVGDVTGYAMRGGRIFIGKDAGYRVGIHMKEYGDKIPSIVIGGNAGSFLAEYQAGGLIVVLSLYGGEKLGFFPCTGMHGGRVYVRGGVDRSLFPDYVSIRIASKADMEPIISLLVDFASFFSYALDDILSEEFTLIEPMETDVYGGLYVAD